MSSGTFPTACTPCKAVSCSCPKPGCLSSRSREEKPASLNFHVPLFRGDGITFPGSFCSWTGEFFHEPAFPGWHCGHALTSGLPSPLVLEEAGFPSILVPGRPGPSLRGVLHWLGRGLGWERPRAPRAGLA